MDAEKGSLCFHISDVNHNKICPISKTPCPFECLYAEVLENISLGIIILNGVEKAVIFQNKAAIEIFKDTIKPKDFKGISAMFVLEPEDFIDPNYPSSQNNLLLGDRYVGFSIYPITRGYLWIFVCDITENMKQEKQVSRLVAAVRAAAEAIVITDTKFHIKYVNPAFERITGYTMEEALGMDASRGYGREMKKILAREGFWKGQVKQNKKDGSMYIEEVFISTVKEHSGNVINYVITKRDVTEKVRLESVAAAINSMENIGYVFSGIRHELGNPINSLMMSLSVLKSKADTFSKDQIKEYANRSLEQIERVGYLLDSLKNFNMFENPKLQTVKLRPFMEDFQSFIKNDMDRKNIDLIVIIHPEVENGFTDPRALQQVFLNITTNALDALDGIENPKIVISMFKRGSFVYVCFTDNGCGMNEEEQSDLFKPFHTSKTNGTGLGLVITKKMLTKMGGTISLSSSKGAGTITEIIIPESK